VWRCREGCCRAFERPSVLEKRFYCGAIMLRLYLKMATGFAARSAEHNRGAVARTPIT
jgi:hypothetical protein